MARHRGEPAEAVVGASRPPMRLPPLAPEPRPCPLAQDALDQRVVRLDAHSPKSIGRRPHLLDYARPPCYVDVVELSEKVQPQHAVGAHSGDPAAYADCQVRDGLTLD